MKVRALNNSHDFTFGAGLNNYVVNNSAIAQNINTRLSSFIGNCFFDLGAGIDWYNLLGSKNEIGLNLAISTIILNTNGVTGLTQLSVSLSTARNFSVSYTVQTVFSLTSGSFLFDSSIG